MGDIKQFFESEAYAVVGASNVRSKFGNKVLRCYLKNDRPVYPINPKETLIEGLNVIDKIENLPGNVKSLSMVTPPEISEQLVDDAIKHGVKNIWFQPGSHNDNAIKKCEKNNINVIANGHCILATTGFEDDKEHA